jgi:hypothetical protein
LTDKRDASRPPKGAPARALILAMAKRDDLPAGSALRRVADRRRASARRSHARHASSPVAVEQMIAPKTTRRRLMEPVAAARMGDGLADVPTQRVG